jgi:Mg-chelatase subunit ChlD
MSIPVYILLDRSSSMEKRWSEALGTINGYVAELAKEGHEGRVTAATFDSIHRGLEFVVIREGTRPQDWKPITNEEASPRGSTPLYDAVAKICSMAQASQANKGVVLIMTDGEENSSREANQYTAKAMLEMIKARGWDVVQLGVDFNAWDQAQALGTDRRNTISTSGATMSSQAFTSNLAGKTRAYASGAVGNMNYTPEEKKEFGDKTG